jgi:hypothetical protein
MCFKNLFRKLGIFRSGWKKARYTNGKNRPIEFQESGVFDAKRDLVTKKDFRKLRKR